MLNLARPGLREHELFTYPLVLAWNHIHNFWIFRGVECEWIHSSDEESNEEYYKPLREMFAKIRQRRIEQRESHEHSSNQFTE